MTDSSLLYSGISHYILLDEGMSPWAAIGFYVCLSNSKKKPTLIGPVALKAYIYIYIKYYIYI